MFLSLKWLIFSETIIVKDTADSNSKPTRIIQVETIYSEILNAKRRAGEPGVFGSLEPEPEPLEKKTRSRSWSRLEKKVRSQSQSRGPKRREVAIGSNF